MEASKEFEAAQESFTERLIRQDEEAAQKIEGTKKIKRKHLTKDKTELENGDNGSNTENTEMTSSEMEIKTNTEMEIDLTSSQTNIENADLQGFGTGTEDRQPGVEITEVPGTDTEMEDRQLSDKNLSDHVQLMKLDPQFEQRLAERLEEELKKDRENELVKEKEKKESASKVEKGKEKAKLSYSEVAKGPGKDIKRPFDEERQSKISRGIDKVLRANSELKTEEFDGRKWHKNNILAAFEAMAELKEFIKHKFESRKTAMKIPEAIERKMHYRDKAFFRTFTRRFEIQPKHQLEFLELLNEATERYKKSYGAHVLNKNNKEQLYDKLRKKLGLDYLTNQEFGMMDAHQITVLILYVVGFARIRNNLNYNDLKKAIEEVQAEVRRKLPTEWKEIPLTIRKGLPCELPIENSKWTGTVAIILRKIYAFERLPESYISDKRERLPDYPEDLRAEVRKLFPLTKREELRDLRRRKEELSKYYHMRALPDDYFELLAKKLELPDAVQDLTPRLREMFPFCPRDDEDFKAHIEELRKVYAFKYLPNDYIIRKKRLPAKPEELALKEKFEFPIMSTETAIRFIEQIPSFYRVVTPLPREYIGVNYTSLEDLPVNWEDVTKVNLTLPITNTKELMIAVKALREFYFFWKIPEDWIQIREKENDKKTKDEERFPTSIEKLNEELQNKNIIDCPKFPIEEQEEVIEAINLLQETFRIETIPEWVFNIKELPEPDWKVFGEDDYEIVDTEDTDMAEII